MSVNLRSKDTSNPVFVFGRERIHSITLSPELNGISVLSGRCFDSEDKLIIGRFLWTRSAILKFLGQSREDKMVITLCGSARFEPEFKSWNIKLSLAGHAVFTLTSYPSDHDGKKDWYTEDEKKKLDQVHLHKIRASDAIVVLNKGGYVGYSCAREILYAESIGVQVRFLDHRLEPSEEAAAILGKMKSSIELNQLNHRHDNPMEWVPKS